MNLTAVFRALPTGFQAEIEGVQGAQAYGATLEEARQNLHRALLTALEIQLSRQQPLFTEMLTYQTEGDALPAPTVRPSLRGFGAAQALIRLKPEFDEPLEVLDLER